MNDQSTDPPVTDRVVVGVDGSEHSLRALDRAVDEAGLRGAELEIVCGRTPVGRGPTPETQVDRERVLKAAQQVVESVAERARERAPDLGIVRSPTDEPAVDALVRASRNAILTVVGTRGHGGFAGLLLGSVSLRLAAHTAGPLMVVRGDAAKVEPESGARDTLVGLKSKASAEAVRFGFEDAVRRRAGLRVLHAWMYQPIPSIALQLPPKEDTEERDAARALVRDAVAPFSREHPEVRVSADELRKSPATALIEASRTAGVLVLSARRAHGRFGLQLGPVTHAALHHAHCPVVLVPTDHEAR